MAKKTWSFNWLRNFVLTLVFGALFLAAPTTLMAEDKPANVPVEQEQVKKEEQKTKEVKEAQPQVNQHVKNETQKQEEKLIQDAVIALDETNKALAALNEKNKEKAIAALEKVIGKLELVIARNPKLALAPVRSSIVMHDLYADAETVEKSLEIIRNDLEQGKIQNARRILKNLASEAVIHVTYMPLASYSEAIKAVVPLIDKGEINEAKSSLRAALRTLVVREEAVIQLPIIRAKTMLGEAEKLAEKKDRSDEEKTELTDLLKASREELNLAQVLGYGKKDDYEKFYAQLDEITEKTKGGKSGKGFFDKIKILFKDYKKKFLD